MFYKEIIPNEFLPNLDLYVLLDEQIKGFIGVSQHILEMLFIDSESRGKGYGKILVKFSLDNLHVTRLDVNEQNKQAVGFYKKMGFKQIGYSEKDAMNKNSSDFTFRI